MDTSDLCVQKCHPHFWLHRPNMQPVKPAATRSTLAGWHNENLWPDCEKRSRTPEHCSTRCMICWLCQQRCPPPSKQKDRNMLLGFQFPAQHIVSVRRSTHAALISETCAVMREQQSREAEDNVKVLPSAIHCKMAKQHQSTTISS